MKTKAAIAVAARKPLEITTVDLEGPKAGEVLVEIKASGVCHTDEFTRSGADPEGLFPAILGTRAPASSSMWGQASPRCARAIMSFRSTHPNAGNASHAPRRKPICARRSARRRARA